MDALAEELMSKLSSKISFVIPYLGIPVPDSVVVTWIIMAFLVLVSIIFVRNLKEVPTGAQIYVEIAVSAIYDFFDGILGKEGRRYVPYLGSVALFIGCANLSPLFGFTPPTKDLNVTASLAIMSIILIEYSSFHKKGMKKWVKGFAEPMAIITPINILEVFIRPLSLCMRLFGNILGGFVIMELIKMAVPLLIPIPFSIYFDIFDGLIQTYVFVFLTALFMKEAMD